MTFDEGSNPPPWGAPPPPPPSSTNTPGHIAPNPYGWGGVPREHPNGTTILVLGILSLVFCGLCGPFAWVMGNTAMRERMNIPLKLGSCHTAVVGRYAIEGHVPAKDVLRLIKERPDAIGLTVPGMPVGSPGMDGPEYGERRDPYDVLLVRADGSTSVFSSYR